MKLAEIPIIDILHDFVPELSSISANGTKRISVKCPFHNGQNAESLAIYVDSNNAYCFGGCGYLDNVGIVSKALGVPQHEARAELMEKYGITTLTPEEENELHRLQLLERYVEACHASLQDEHKQALKARGLTEKTILENKIGYHSENFNGLTEQELLELGIYRKDLEGNIVSDFFGKIILPCYLNGRLIYIIAWNYLGLENEPKYAGPAGWPKPVVGTTGEDSLLVEGYFDMLACQQAGFDTICTLGDTPTKEQIAFLRKQPSLTIAFDGDEAGQKAARELTKSLYPAARLLPLPAGEDPNSMLVSLGPEKFREYLETAKRIDPLEEAVAEAKTQGNPVAAARVIASEAAPLLAKLEPIQRAVAIKALTTELKEFGITKVAVEKQIAGLEDEGTNEPSEDRYRSWQTSFFVDGSTLFEQVYEDKRNFFLSFDAETGKVEKMAGIELEGESIEPIYGEDVELEAVKLPTGIEEYNDTLTLLAEIEKHIGCYLDVSPSYLKFASYYVLLSWLYDRFNTLPYLRALGDTGCGKSRFLDVIGGLCYKPISASGCVTPAPIYRMLRRWAGTLILDEADMKNSDEYNEVVTILNCGFERGRPVIRATKDNPDKIQILPVYGPKVFATRRRFKDVALEARCLTEIMRETDRDDIPPVLGKKFSTEQILLRNKLLLFRFRNYFSVDPEAVANLNLGNIEPRLRQISEAFTSLFANEPAVLGSFKQFIQAHQRELIEQRAATKTGIVVETLLTLLEEQDGTTGTGGTTLIGDSEVVPVSAGDIAEKTGLSSQAVGAILKGLGIETKLNRHAGGRRRQILFNEALFRKLRKRYVVPDTDGEQPRESTIEVVPHVPLVPDTDVEQDGTTGTSGTSYMVDSEVVPASSSSDVLAVDIETTGLSPRSYDIRLVSCAGEGAVGVWDDPDPIRVFLETPEVTKVFHNAAFDVHWLTSKGYPVNNYQDTMLMSQVLDNNQNEHSLEALAKEKLGITLDKSLQGPGNWQGMITDLHREYCRKDSEATLKLFYILRKELAQAGLEEVYRREILALPAIIRLQQDGMYFDAAAWRKDLAGHVQEREELEAEIKQELRTEINLGSPKQLLDCLQNRGLKLGDTSDETLAMHEGEMPVLALLRQWREKNKLVTSYGEELLKLVGPDGRLYPSWRLIGATTGRMSCKNPNLQQVPHELRKYFIAPPERVLVIADYSQIELRVAADLSTDKTMIASFRAGEDLHIKTARAIFRRDEITKQERQIAKTANFGLIYGMSAPGLRARVKTMCGLNITEAEAEKFRHEFFSLYQGIRNWQDKQIKAAVIRTKGGRRWEGLPKPPAAGWRNRLNYPVQGTAAEGLKEAMALMVKELPMDWKLAAVVHDEIVLDVPESQAEEAKQALVRWMVDGMKKLITTIPVEVDCKISESWQK